MTLRRRLSARALLLAALLPALPGLALASTSSRFCGAEPLRSVAQQDRVLQVAELLRAELAATGTSAALVARAGTQLGRFGIRYTHAAVALQANPVAPWAVRQLYFACDERRSRLFDQGLAAFLLGADEPDRGFASLLLLPPAAAEALSAASLDTAGALRLVAPQYLANAHPQDLERQNCNQWLAELLARAWGQADDRPSAQAQLARWDYAPTPVRYGNPLWRLAVAFVPWVGFAGHPEADGARHEVVTSLPPDLEALSQRLWPGAQRVELCYTPTHAVLRRGGPPLPADCSADPLAGDRVLPL